MDNRQAGLCAVLAAGVMLGAPGVRAQEPADEPRFPVSPEVFADEPFTSCEGIGFNGLGDLYATCNRALWRVGTDGQPSKVVDLDSNLGVAGIGARDLLVADFGPTNAFRDGRNSDGIVWRISPDGTRVAHATGIGDPNFVLVRADGSYLVSDDATSDIYLVQPGGEVSLYATAVNHPNGLAFSPDESMLYVAQMFSNIRPVVGVNRLWGIRLVDGMPARDARLLATTGPEAFVDGLAVDSAGRVYIAANREGRIWRFDPRTEELVMVAENVVGAASLAFGEGLFDRESLFVTTTFSAGRGGKIFRIPVGIDGAALHR